MNKNSELDAFCSLIETHHRAPTYEEYEEALSTTKKGKILFMRRQIKERWINNYNPEILHAWNANMDFKLAIDTFAIITYIVSYMNKEKTI